MAFSPVQNRKLHHQIDRVLHVPGNYRGGILEMTMVIDSAFSKEDITTLCKDVIASCKSQSEVFRNVRLNVVKWESNQITNEVTGLAYLQMGKYFDNYCQEISEAEDCDEKKQKFSEDLLAYLKKFHARSKLIIVLAKTSDSMLPKQDKEAYLQAMNPFLKQKLIVVTPENVENGGDLVRKQILG